MSYDPGEDFVDDDAPFIFDALGLKYDQALNTFFEQFIPSKPVNFANVKEELLVSALGWTRVVDDKLLADAKIPVIQKKPPVKKDRPVDISKPKAASREPVNWSSSTPSPPPDSNSSSVYSTSTSLISSIAASTVSDLPPLPALESPARPPPSKLLPEQLAADPEALVTPSMVVIDPEIVVQQPVVFEPIKKKKEPTPPIQTLTVDKRQLELNKKLIESKKIEQKKETKEPKKWWKLDFDINLNPAQIFSSSNANAKSKPLSNGNSTKPSTVAGPSQQKASSTSAPTVKTQTSSTNASHCPPPTQITLLITNFAVYVFTPAIFKDGRYSLDLNTYKRYPLLEILLVSLPYRSGISYSGGDYALRINDFSLHLVDDRTVWLLSPRGKRSMVVEVISDAYLQLSNTQLDMQQPDYTELIASILDQSIYSMIKEMQRKD
jgi:hypothetical protein